MDQNKSNQQYDEVISSCRTEFFKKNGEYGQSWQRYRASSLLEKIGIKLERVQKIQHVRTQKIDDTIQSEFPAIINYSILGRIKCHQWREGEDMHKEVSNEELQSLYDQQVQKIKDIFVKKNHDYNESWRRRTIGFMVDEMLTKHDRGVAINKNNTLVNKPEKFEEIFSDICNYAIFCKILIDEGVDPMI